MAEAPPASNGPDEPVAAAPEGAVGGDRPAGPAPPDGSVGDNGADEDNDGDVEATRSDDDDDDIDFSTPLPQRSGIAVSRPAGDQTTGNCHGMPAADDGRHRFPVHVVRPCSEIMDEDEDAGGSATLAARYGGLTRPLRLVGDLALRPDPRGGAWLFAELRERAPWFGPAIEVIERQMGVALWAGRPWLQWRPLILVGPPGVGKSHLARLLASLGGTRAFTLNCGGLDDVRLLGGTARGWRSAQACWPAVAMTSACIANPLLIADEIDKVDPVRGQAVHDVLLAMTEPSTARAYYDPCLLADIDLSACLWVMTANDASRLPPTLLSRAEVVVVEGPSVEHFDLALAGIVADLAAGWGVPPAALPELPVRAVEVLRWSFGRRPSLRALRRHAEDVFAALLRDRGPSSH